MRAGARAILDRVGIGGTVSVRQRIQDLSGGQRQCIAIGRAVGWSRRMVFLDEPTAALGVRQTRHVLDLIGRLRAQGIAVVLISHNMEQVLEVCERIVVLRLGRKVADRPVAGLTGPMVVGYITGAERGEVDERRVFPSKSPLFLTVGDIDVDVLINVDRLPTRDGKVNGAVVQKAPGGMAGNVAVALARLSARVRILGRVGDDAEGDFAVSGLARGGVDTSFVSRLAGATTFSCISLLTPDGEKALVKLMTTAYRPEAVDVTEAVLAGVSHGALHVHRRL